MKGRILAVSAGAAIVASVAVTAASGAPRLDPGVTSSTITIGGTFPLTGVASLYKTIPAAEKAYFDYVNDHGGVHGRKINFTILDDAYDPSKTVPLTQELVEKDKVFADYGSLGTASNLSVWGYLNGKHVPQVGIATGDSYWGFSAKKYPWTVGFQPDYPGEGKIYGKYIAASMPNAKIGVLYQNDAFGKNYYAGLRVGLGAKKGNVVSAQSYDVTQASLAQQILTLKAAGADTFVIFATPTAAITALVTATKVGWAPTATFLGNVSANRLFLLAAAGLGANVNGVISSTYLLSSSNTADAGKTGVKFGAAILSQYAPSLSPSYARGDGNVMFGLANAWMFVNALQRAGTTPTRLGLMKAYKSLNTGKDPFVYTGIKLQTSAKDNFPIEQEILIKWSGGATGDWATFGKLYNNVR
ncbi:MAG TPA: ABC transporter substrate-binding protein [Gaiellaceae bacterium]|nr:ABC transporter substrate-binding protein [Gaiellaceae bacterium]